MKPLHGDKTHPLSAFALRTLASIALKPIPRQEINPGVVNRLLREELVEQVLLVSPYEKRKYVLIDHLRISQSFCQLRPA